jgi:hypothetical protein
MSPHLPHCFTRRLAFGSLLATLASPFPAQGQDRQPPRSPDPEELTRYARAFSAIGESRNQAQAELAKPANKTREAQQDLRDKLVAEIAKARKARGLTDERYEQITFLISADPALRKSFEEVLAQIAPEKKPPS